MNKNPGLTGAAPNRLARETSPYLLLHATNPVDWYPWGEEALARARDEDKPIFLSVGYSTCYWCHVMERECFSSPEIAKLMNEGFVSIKVDREERPDLDEIYMAATQLLTRSGGWPNSVFLTPDLKPFFAGTYFPPRDAMGRPGFPRVLQSLREAWALRRVEVRSQAETIAEAMREHLSASAETGGPLDPGAIAATERALASRFDAAWGGFSRAPKFPSPSNLAFLLERAEAGSAEASDMLVTTLDRMARGGLYDQVGGGFHRYSTDHQWLVPHFEKMLYDNAALAPLYAAADGLAPELGFARVARETLAFVLAEMTGPHGGFLSAIDAETDGHEGFYYTFTRDDLKAALPAGEEAFLAAVLGFSGAPNFEHTRYVLHLPRPLALVAKEEGLSIDAVLERLRRGRAALLLARSARERPLVDDKVLADWNGLMIAGFAESARRLSDASLLEPARRAAHFVLQHLRPAGGPLLHVWREGQARVPAFLDDYAFLVHGLLALHAATAEPRFREEAVALVREQEERLSDPAGGYFAAGAAPDLLFRAKPGFDGAVASGNGVSVLNLLELHRVTGDGAYRERAEAALTAFGRDLGQMPLAQVTLVRGLGRLLAAEAVVPSASGVGPRAPAPLPQAQAPQAPSPSPIPSAPLPGARAASLRTASATEGLEDEAREVVEVQGELGPGHDPVRTFTVELRIRRGFHLYAHEAGAPGLVATRLSAILGRLEGVLYPEGEALDGGPRAYRGKVRIEGRIAMPKTGGPSLELEYQACDDARCLPAVTRMVRLA